MVGSQNFYFFLFVFLLLLLFPSQGLFRGYKKKKTLPSYETVLNLPSLSVNSSSFEGLLSSFFLPSSRFPSLYAFQMEFLRNLNRVIEIDEGETQTGNLTRLSPTTWEWTTFTTNRTKKNCGGDDYYVFLDWNGDWQADGQWNKGARKLNRPVAQVTDNMDGTYIFDFSDLSCSALNGGRWGEKGKKGGGSERKGGESERKLGESMGGSIVVLLQSSQGYGNKFYPRKESCHGACYINRVLFKEPVSLSSFFSSSSSYVPPPSTDFLCQREKLNKGIENKNFIPFLAHFSHIFIAGDSLGLQMHGALQELLGHNHLNFSSLPLLPSLPTTNPGELKMKENYFPQVFLADPFDLRMMLLHYNHSPFQKFVKRVAGQIEELIKEERERKGEREGEEGEEGEGIAVVINTGLWNMLGDESSQISDPLYSHHIIGLDQWIVDFKSLLPPGVKVFFREIVAPQSHGVHCRNQKCINRIKYLSQGRAKFIGSLQNLLMKQHGIETLGTYHIANEGTPKTGDGRHYINNLYHRLWKSWGTVDGKWVTVTPCS